MRLRPAGISTLSLHDALPISSQGTCTAASPTFTCALGTIAKSGAATVTIDYTVPSSTTANQRSEEHTSELQSHSDLVCRLLLEKKKRSRQPSPESHRVSQQPH